VHFQNIVKQVNRFTCVYLSVTDGDPALLRGDRLCPRDLGRDRARWTCWEEWRKCGKHLLLQVFSQTWSVIRQL